MKTLMVPTLKLDSSGTAARTWEVMRWQPGSGQN